MVIKAKKEERKIAILLEDLASLENYARDLFSFLPLPIFLVNPAGIILEVNPAFKKIAGYKTEEIIGKPIKEIFNQTDAKNIIKATLKKGFIEAKEIILFTKEKKKVPVSVSTVLRKSKEGEVIGYFIGLFDLSQIRKTEIELKNTQSALLNILEDVNEARRKAEEEANKTLFIINNFTDGLLVFDRENKLSLINPKAENFFDVKTTDVIGKSIYELGTLPSLEFLTKLVGPDLKEIFRKEFKIKENLILEISTVLAMSGGKRLETLIIIHDITREKIIEKMKTEFVSISAHQLRTPLSAIKWTLRMLLDGDLGELTTEQREFIERTYYSNEKMISLINDLLDVTRIEEGRYLFKPTPTEIIPIVQSVIDFYKEEIKKRRLKLEFRRPEKKLPKIIMDVEKIKLAIQNLLDNAIKYTPPGGNVTIYLKHGKKEIEFSIKDSGAGIPKDQQRRIFSKFFRGTNVIRMETEGSGLGLFIVKNIIEAHGGKVWFDSEEGKGTTFHFSLPIEEGFAEFLKEF